MSSRAFWYCCSFLEDSRELRALCRRLAPSRSALAPARWPLQLLLLLAVGARLRSADCLDALKA
jgi:hypothetical protein